MTIDYYIDLRVTCQEEFRIARDFDLLPFVKQVSTTCTFFSIPSSPLDDIAYGFRKMITHGKLTVAPVLEACT